jgi:hypothetical protein
LKIDLSDLLSSLFNHLIAILDLLLEMVGKLLLLSLLKVVE